MRRLGGLWHRVTAFENLHAAYRKARLGKRTRPSVAKFALNLEGELLALQRALREGSYRPGAYRLFTIYERKPRTLTSQFFANLYLDGLDRAMRTRLGAAAYLRYVDDMVVLDDDKGRLHEVRDAVREHLECERLRLHPRKAHVSPVRDGLDLLGYRVWPHRRRLRNDNGHRFARRLRGYAAAYARGDMDWGDVHPRVRSWVGHALQADTAGLRRRILSGTVFSRGVGRQTAVG